MKQLHDSFNKKWKEQIINPLLLIATYILDFLCIHPFLDGNGRLSRLISLVLLYHIGHDVGRYISIEKIIEDTKEEYYASLMKSSKEWHKGKHNLQPWWEYFLLILLETYKKFEQRVGYIQQSKGSKTGLIIETINNFRSSFSVQDLQEQCPTVGIDLIRRILRKLKNQKKIICLGKGPRATWKNKR
ncbi:MAG: hypothetical protein K940chlam4_00057 [Candidatus Anoxychlamydiales bacterium]|nr:hypothetical protein [Candidatus Anoxychlamydiales bacterium]